jgi:hypothetical protein
MDLLERDSTPEQQAIGDRAAIEKYLGTKYGITVAGGTAKDPSIVPNLLGWWKADSLLPTGGVTESCDVSRDDAPDGSWLGVHGVELGAVAPKPSYQVGTLPPELVPALDAAKFTTGVFPPEVFPVADGANHGMVPDPGFIGLPTDYLGRDMQWHTTAPEIIGIPTAPMPVISLDSWSDKEVIVTVRSELPDSSLFTLVQKYPNYESPGFSLVKLKDDK